MSLYEVLLYFVLFSVLGWCLEVVSCSINTGKFVNRGFLNGPVCPIYGFGGVAIILLLRPLEDNLVVLFFAAALVCSALELVTGFLLKKLFHTTWWDYSEKPFNIGGYICLQMSLAWGLAGVVLVRVLFPALAGLTGLLPRWLGWVLLGIAFALFLADSIVTVNAILKLNRDLGEITRLADTLHQGSERLAKSIGNNAINISDKIKEIDLENSKEKIEEKITEGRELVTESMSATVERMELAAEGRRDRKEKAQRERREKMEAALEESRERLEHVVEEGREKLASLRPVAETRTLISKLQSNQQRQRRRLLDAFPNMRSRQYNDALDGLRNAYREWQGKLKSDESTGDGAGQQKDEKSEKNTPDK